MKVYYRISNASSAADRFANKRQCLENFLRVFDGHDITIIADRLIDAMEFPEALITDIIATDLGNAGSFKLALRLACEKPDDTPVYFCEDDYLHLPGCPTLLVEGLGIADYATCYDAGDKYASASKGGNPLLEFDYEIAPVQKTASTHWKFTNSTTMTFAATAEALKADRKVWEHYASQFDAPLDFLCFQFLREDRHARIASCIPGRSTHVHGGWPSPFVDWQAVAKGASIDPLLPSFLSDPTEGVLVGAYQ